MIRDTHASGDAKPLSDSDEIERRTNMRSQNITIIPPSMRVFLPTLLSTNQLPMVPAAPIPDCPQPSLYAEEVEIPARV